MSDKIDIVVPWVDGSDPAWMAEKEKYEPDKECHMYDLRKERYRDYRLMRYFFRGLEKYADWANRIFFVTWGHVPTWLDTSHEKLRIVRHEDFIPEEYLPVFDICPIEMNLHRIPDLSEQYLYLNDDYFFISKTETTDFFEKGLPKDMLALQPVVANESDCVMPYIFLNNAMVLARHFDKRDRMRSNPGHFFHVGYPPKYFFYNLMERAFPRFTGFYTQHGPSPMLKSTLATLWQEEGELMHAVSQNRFRSRSDVNQYLQREWTKLSGRFVPSYDRHLVHYENLGENPARLLQTIRKQKAKVLVINDAYGEFAYEELLGEIRKALEERFPEPSSFERET